MAHASLHRPPGTSRVCPASSSAPQFSRVVISDRSLYLRPINYPPKAPYIYKPDPSTEAVKMVNFDFETANATQLMNEIIRITLTEYNALGEKIAQPVPEEDEQEMVDEMMEKYLDNERILDTYFEKLKELLKKSPPGQKELEMKQRQIENLIKKNGLE